MMLQVAPLATASPALVGPVTFQLPATRLTGPAPTIAPLHAAASGRVDLSQFGKVLSALDLFRDELNSGLATAATPAARAQVIVTAFNHLQTALDKLALPAADGSAQNAALRLLDLFRQLAGDALANGAGSLTSIGIGIGLNGQGGSQASLSLRLDIKVFDQALASDNPATLALLALLLQMLNSSANLLGGQAASTDSASLIAGRGLLTPDLTRLLATPSPIAALTSAGNDSLASAISSAATAANLLSGTTPRTAGSELQITLAATSPLPASSTSPPAASAALAPGLPAASPATAAALSAGTTPQPATPTITVTAVTPGSAAVAAGETASNTQADPLAEARRLAANAALQGLIDDPGRRALANSSFDPAYGALMAAFNVASFVTPGNPIHAPASGDLPAAVAAVSPGPAAA